MEAVAGFAAEGGPVLGICNGFQVLCEAGLLPGALLPNEGLRFICRQVELVAEDFAGPFGSAIGGGDRLSIPIKHMSGRYFAPDDELDRLEAKGGSPSATPPGKTRTAAFATSPASSTRRGTCSA